MKPTDPQHEARREAFDAACEQLARQQDRSISMATATKPKKSTGKAPPTPQTPPPPATETRVLPDGTIQRFKDGKLIKTTPPPKGNGNATPKPAAKAKPATVKAPKGPTPGAAFYVAKLGTEDIWHFAPLSAEPGAAVQVRHFKGYDVLSDHRRPASFATKLYDDLLKAGFVYIDGVTHRLIDEYE